MKKAAQHKATLWLLPVTLGDTPVETVLPSYNLDVIRSLEYFIAEDLRSARRFLRSAGYHGDLDPHKFQTLNEHTRENDFFDLVSWIQDRGVCGLLSESGLPCIADPGARLVQLARAAGIHIRPLSGPSSLFLALMASGFDGQHFTFHGYLPIDKSVRAQTIRELERNARQGRGTQIFIEAPYRNNQMLAELLRLCSPETWLCVASELTTPQEWIRADAIASWKKSLVDLHKRNAVFLLAAYPQ